MRHTVLAIIILLLTQIVSLAQSPVPVPVGSIVMWSGNDNLLIHNSSQPPPGWLMANGNCVSQDDYSELYSVVSNIYDTTLCESGEFNLPNLNGRFPFGANGSNSFGRNRTLGFVDGDEFVTLSIAEMPSHTHFVRNFFDSGVPGSDVDFMFFQQGTGDFIAADFTDAAGSNLPHENTPPYLAIGFMIKALPDAVETTPITSTYDINIQFADSANVSITRTMITTGVEQYVGDINLPAFYKSFDAIYTIAMFMIFLLVGSAAGKPTLFVISFIGLYITGVLQNGGNYITFPIIILGASYIIYKFLIVRRRA